MEKEAPCGRLRVDAVGDALEMDLLGFKFIHQVPTILSRYARADPGDGGGAVESTDGHLEFLC